MSKLRKQCQNLNKRFFSRSNKNFSFWFWFQRRTTFLHFFPKNEPLCSSIQRPRDQLWLESIFNEQVNEAPQAIKRLFQRPTFTLSLEFASWPTPTNLWSPFSDYKSPFIAKFTLSGKISQDRFYLRVFWWSILIKSWQQKWMNPWPLAHEATVQTIKLQI